jgi:predicted Zn-ribbon and HTH transcriptional regulator
MTDMEQQVISVMKEQGKPLKAAEIADLMGVEKKEVDKAMKGLKKTASISSPKNCYWEPSD